MDRLQAMKDFERVVEEGGFAAAARAMDMSPPVVTRMVAELEQHLGTRLLQRTTRKLALTDAGESYLQRVRAILHEIDDAEAAAAASTRDLRGTIRIVAAPVLATNFLAPMVAVWHACYPKLMLDISMDAYASSRVDEFDVTIMVAGEDFDANIVARPLVQGEAIVVASPDYLERRGIPREPQDLIHHDYLPDSSARAPAVRAWPQAAPAVAAGGCARRRSRRTGGVAVRQYRAADACRCGRGGRGCHVAPAGRGAPGPRRTGAHLARLDLFALHDLCGAALGPHAARAHAGVSGLPDRTRAPRHGGKVRPAQLSCANPLMIVPSGSTITCPSGMAKLFWRQASNTVTATALDKLRLR